MDHIRSTAVVPERRAAGRWGHRRSLPAQPSAHAVAIPPTVETATVRPAGRRRIRRALTGLAVAAAIAAPTLATASPAQAQGTGGGCPPTWCGDGNHTEAAGRRRIRRALTGLAVAAAIATPTLATASPAGAASSGSCPAYWCGNGNHNEAAGRDRMSGCPAGR